MATTIVTKSGSGAPTASDLVAGELAVDLTNKRLYTEDSGGTVLELGTNPSGNVTFGDNGKAIFGAGSDLQIYHNATSNIIDSSAATLAIQAPQFVVQDDTGAKNIIWVTQPAASVFDVRLSYDGTTKLATTATGIDVTGSVTADGLTVNGAGSIVALSDNAVFNVNVSGGTSKTSTINQRAKSSNGSNADTSIVVTGSSGEAVSSWDFKLDTANGALTKAMSIDGSGDISFYEDTGTTPKFFWDASLETLTLGGTEWPTTNIGEAAGRHMINYDGEPRLFLWDTSTGAAGNESYLMLGGKPTSSATTISGGSINGGVENASDAAGYLAFNTTNSAGTFAEAMRIDASGNLLVSDTTANPSGDNVDSGIALHNAGLVRASTNNAAAPLDLNIKGRDGIIADFRKDGTTVGSIGSLSGIVTEIVLDPRTDGASLTGGTNKISPGNQSGALDAHLDLGSSGTRFKDLYLSGGVYLGGTGAANLLDDYEEGTWTPVLVGSTTAGTATFVSGPVGTYTKIGNQVTVTFNWNISAHTGAGALRVTGLPFALGAGVGVGSVMDGNYTYTSGRTRLVPWVSTSTLRLYGVGDGVGYLENTLDSSHQMNGSITYQTT